jgi:hypothetical protein
MNKIAKLARQALISGVWLCIVGLIAVNWEIIWKIIAGIFVVVFGVIGWAFGWIDDHVPKYAWVALCCTWALSGTLTSISGKLSRIIELMEEKKEAFDDSDY